MQQELQLMIYQNAKYIWFVNAEFLGNILNKSELICLHTVIWFQVPLSNPSSLIYIINWFRVLLCNTNNPVYVVNLGYLV